MVFELKHKNKKPGHTDSIPPLLCRWGVIKNVYPLAINPVFDLDNIVGKIENVDKQHFFPFSQVFLNCYRNTYVFLAILNFESVIAWTLAKFKILSNLI